MWFFGQRHLRRTTTSAKTVWRRRPSIGLIDTANGLDRTYENTNYVGTICGLQEYIGDIGARTVVRGMK